MTAPLDVSILPLRLESQGWRPAVRAAAVTTEKRLYLWLRGPLAEQPPTHPLLNALGPLYDEVASHKPTLDAVPLCPCASYTAESVAALPAIQAVLSSSESAEDAQRLVDRIDGQRSGHGQPPVQLQPLQLEPELAQHPDAAASLPADPTVAADKAADRRPDPPQQQHGQRQPVGLSSSGRTDTPHRPQQQHQQPELESAVQQQQSGGGDTDTAKDEVLQFEHVAVGGTFDRLHAGHRVLLAATALVATKSVYIGITADALLANKANKELLEPFEVRRDAAVGFTKAVHPGLDITAGALTDPKAPTAAATEERMQALVVSQETLKGGEAINEYRLEHGFPALKLVVVDLVGITDKQGNKLSSTALRAAEAARLRGSGPQQGS